MAVNATFGTVEYREGGILAVPITFAENVIAASKTVFAVTYLSGSALQGIEYVLLGSGTDYELVFTVPPDRSGSFRVSADGDVLKASGAWDTVVVTAITVDYSTVGPRIIDAKMPPHGVSNLGSPADVLVAYNTVVTGWNVNNTITKDGAALGFPIFEIGGAEVGQASPYKWIGSDDPDFETLYSQLPNLRDGNGRYDADANNAALLNLGWQILASPPGGSPTPGTNNFDAEGQWHGESGKFFLIRFSGPQEVGIFNLREIVGRVRGLVKPVS